MSAADELQKLSELLKNGVITQNEFDKQKSTILSEAASGAKIKKKWTWWQWGLLGSILFLLFIFNTGGGGLPECNSSEAKHTLQEAFNKSQFARLLGLSSIETTENIEVSYDEKTKLRVCKGKITMNNTSVVDVDCKIQGKLSRPA